MLKPICITTTAITTTMAKSLLLAALPCLPGGLVGLLCRSACPGHHRGPLLGCCCSSRLLCLIADDLRAPWGAVPAHVSGDALLAAGLSHLLQILAPALWRTVLRGLPLPPLAAAFA